MKRYADSTLKGMTKDELIRYVRICEHNEDVLEEMNNRQFEIFKDWKPVKHARWVHSCIENYSLCSNCHCDNEVETDYCPNCGAIMDKED